MALTCKFAKRNFAFLWLVIQVSWYFFNGCECQKNGDVRLVGGSVPLEGRVEVYYDGQWGTVCDDFWDDKDATVVCRQLGFNDNGTAVLQAAFGEGNGPIWMDNVQCNGTEHKLQSCDYREWSIHNCDHTEDASVVCNLGNGEIRLVGGSSSTEGRVEVLHDGQWGRVCSHYWDANDAKVVCRQLGFNVTATPFWSATNFGEGSGPVWLDDVGCTGNEGILQNCSHRGWGTENCRDHQIAGVRCNLGENFRDSYHEIRLVGGTAPNEGRVEVFYEPSRSWSTVCDDGWDDKDAVVVCRQLGFNSGGTAVPHATFGDGSGLIRRGGIDCTGEEAKLTDCRNAEWRTVSYCDHTEDAGVRCNDVRLTYGEGLYEGRVEVFHGGEWGTVCDDAWNDADARVVCRQLGFGPGGRAIRRSFFGSTTRIRFHGTDCTGTETSLLDCDNSGWSDEKCNSVEDVGVSCIEEQLDIPPAFVIIIAVMLALLLVIIAILVYFVIWIRQMKLSLTPKVNSSPGTIEMRPKNIDSRATSVNKYRYKISEVYDDPPEEYDDVYENNGFHGPV